MLADPPGDRPPWQLWLLWVAATYGGFTVGTGLGFVLPLRALAVLAVGATLGLSQWLLLRWTFGVSVLWIAATTAGLIPAAMVGVSINDTLALSLLFGAGVGFTQSLLLANSARWFLFSIAGWTAGIEIVWHLFSRLPRLPWRWASSAVGFAGLSGIGLVAGCITGIPLLLGLHTRTSHREPTL